MIDELHRVAQAAIIKTVLTEGFPAILGRSDGTLFFVDAAGVTQRDRVWARTGQGDSSAEMVVYAGSVPRQYGLPVIVAERQGRPTVIRTDNSKAAVFAGGRMIDVAEHAWTHGRYGPDPLYVTGAAFLPLMARPSDTPNLTVTVEQGFYNYQSTVKLFPQTVSASLSSYVPTVANGQTFIVLCLNRSTNALAVVTGYSSVSPPTTIPFTSVNVLAILTGLATTHFPICAIRLYTGQTRILAPDIFMDARFYANSSSINVLNDLTDVVITSPVVNDILFYDGSQWENGPGAAGTLPIVHSEFSIDDATAAATGSFATRGMRVKPTQAMKLYGLCYIGDLVASAVYRAVVFTHNGTTISAITATSPTYTVGASDDVTDQRIWFYFDTPVAMAAGTEYGCCISRTDGGDTYSLPISNAAASRIPFAVSLAANTRINVAKATPVATDAVDVTTGNQFAMGYCWSIDGETLPVGFMQSNIDHGALAGLADDDHTQYLLATGARTGATTSPQPFTLNIIAPWTDTALRSGSEGNHFNDNSATYPTGWTESDAPLATNTNYQYGFWRIDGSTVNNAWKYRKQTGINIGSTPANTFNSFWFGPCLIRDGGYTSDVDYFFGIYRDNAGAIDENTFIRLHLWWDSATVLWKIRAERKDGTTQTNGTFYTSPQPPLVQPLHFRVIARNDTNRLVRAYIGNLPLFAPQFQLMNANIGSSVTWGQVWWQMHMSRGATGIDDYVFIGGIDYNLDV